MFRAYVCMKIENIRVTPWVISTQRFKVLSLILYSGAYSPMMGFSVITWAMSTFLRLKILKYLDFTK